MSWSMPSTMTISMRCPQLDWDFLDNKPTRDRSDRLLRRINTSDRSTQQIGEDQTGKASNKWKKKHPAPANRRIWRDRWPTEKRPEWPKSKMAQTMPRWKETPNHLLIEWGTIMRKGSRSMGGYRIDVEEIPTLEPLHVLHFWKKLRLERLL